MINEVSDNGGFRVVSRRDVLVFEIRLVRPGTIRFFSFRVVTRVH